MRTNTKTSRPTTYNTGKATVTYQGGVAITPADKELIKRLIMSNFLWEDSFYESGSEAAKKIADVVKRIAAVDPEYIRNVAIEARKEHNLRHVPLYLAALLAQNGKLTSDTVYGIVNRPDEMAELLNLYWKVNGREAVSTAPKKISKALQKGLAQAFTKFDKYQLGKYNRDKDISLTDVMYLVRPKPLNFDQASWWKALSDGTLESPDTWEVALSAGKNKKETWERLLSEGKLGYQALLMNLRNMKNENVDEELVFNALRIGAGRAKMLPFQFITAAKYNPYWESVIEEAMLSSLRGLERLSGTTVFLVDVSGSMKGTISAKGEMTRLDAASALAMLLREVCENVKIFIYDHNVEQIPDRHGFALRAAIGQPRGSTNLPNALRFAAVKAPNPARVIVFTDEQTVGKISYPNAPKGYIMNVASYDRGVGYNTNWTHIHGFSENLVKYVYEVEKEGN